MRRENRTSVYETGEDTSQRIRGVSARPAGIPEREGKKGKRANAANQIKERQEREAGDRINPCKKTNKTARGSGKQRRARMKKSRAPKEIKSEGREARRFSVLAGQRHRTHIPLGFCMSGEVRENAQKQRNEISERGKEKKQSPRAKTPRGYPEGDGGCEEGKKGKSERRKIPPRDAAGGVARVPCLFLGRGESCKTPDARCMAGASPRRESTEIGNHREKHRRRKVRRKTLAFPISVSFFLFSLFFWGAGEGEGVLFTPLGFEGCSRSRRACIREVYGGEAARTSFRCRGRVQSRAKETKRVRRGQAGGHWNARAPEGTFL